MNKKDVVNFLNDTNFIPSKKMGQNFLINENINRKLVSLANIKEDQNIIEIGPGLGAITKYLHEATKNLLLIELDKRLFSFIDKTYPDVAKVNNDVLKLNLDELIKEHQFKHVKVVANLPYSISSKIILKILESQAIDEMFILVQKEMAQRLLAKKNTKDYNAFTVLVSMFSDISHLLSVNRLEFVPPPQVESWYISIKKKTKYDVNVEAIGTFLKKCFLAKRKKLINNLQNYYNKTNLIKIFETLKLDLNTRAEQLDVEIFYQLYLHCEGL